MTSLRANWRKTIPIVAVATVVTIALASGGAGRGATTVTTTTPAGNEKKGAVDSSQHSAKKSSGAPSKGAQSPAGTASAPAAQEPAAPLPALHGVLARRLTSGSKIVKPGSSVETQSIHPRPGGAVLIWVGSLTGEQNAPTPTVTGAGLSFHLVDTITKRRDDAPRRLSLLAAPLVGRPGSGPLTIHFGREIQSSEWLWMVVQVTGRTTVQSATNGDGNWVNTYTVNYSRRTIPNNAALAGFLFGRNQQHPVAAPPMRGLAMVEGQSPSVTIFVQWTTVSVSSARCDWQRPGHAMAVAVEMAT